MTQADAKQRSDESLSHTGCHFGWEYPQRVQAHLRLQHINDDGIVRQRSNERRVLALHCRVDDNQVGAASVHIATDAHQRERLATAELTDDAKRPRTVALRPSVLDPATPVYCGPSTARGQ